MSLTSIYGLQITLREFLLNFMAPLSAAFFGVGAAFLLNLAYLNHKRHRKNVIETLYTTDAVKSNLNTLLATYHINIKKNIEQYEGYKRATRSDNVNESVNLEDFVSFLPNLDSLLEIDTQALNFVCYDNGELGPAMNRLNSILFEIKDHLKHRNQIIENLMNNDMAAVNITSPQFGFAALRLSNSDASIKILVKRYTEIGLKFAEDLNDYAMKRVPKRTLFFKNWYHLATKMSLPEEYKYILE